jgi:hypothetical protein
MYIYGGMQTQDLRKVPYGKDWCVPSRRESSCVSATRPLSSRCCRAEGSDFIPGHSLIVSHRRDEYSCGSGPLGKDARLMQSYRTRTSSASSCPDDMNRSLEQSSIFISLRDEGRLTTSDNPSQLHIVRDSRDDGRRLCWTDGESFSSTGVDAASRHGYY